MKLIAKILLFLILMFTPFLFAKATYAIDYKVKSLIVIPSDWKDRVSQDQRNTYKDAINRAMTDVQAMYDKLLGATFQFDSNVIIEDTVWPSSVTNSRFGGTTRYEDWTRQYLGTDKGWVVAYWFIGTPNGSRHGGATNSETGDIWMRHQDLIALSENGSTDQKKISLVYLSHELGHAFGLNFVGLGKGHPCTEVKKDECIDNVSEYPPASEWTSIMGYGKDYTGFPHLFFNNTKANPEIWKVCQSPFINCPSIPDPTESKTSDKVSITELYPTTIVAGQSFEIRGSGFNKIKYFRLEKLPEREIKVTTKDKLEIIEKTDGRVVVQTPEDLVDPNSEGEWIIFGVGFKDDDLEQNRLTIKGKQTNSIVLEDRVQVTCGEEDVPLAGVTAYLLNEGHGIKYAEGVTDENGSVNLAYTIENPVSSAEYHVGTSSLKINEKYVYSMTEDGSSLAKLFVPDPPADFSATTNFSFAECSGEANASPSPASEASLATPTPSPTVSQGSSSLSGSDNNSTGNSNLSSQSQVTKIQISNYSDFRESNALDDFGSKTVTIDNPASYKKEGITGNESWDEVCPDDPKKAKMVCATWHLNTLSSDSNKKIYLRVFEGDSYTDYQYLKGDGEVTQVPFKDPLIAIKTQVDNKLIKATAIVNGQGIDIDMESGTKISLEGNVDEDKDFNIAYEIEDAKEGVKRSAIKVVYRPGRAAASPTSSSSSSPSPTATITGWECDYDEENSQFFIKENYSDGTWKIERVCDDQNGGRFCRALDKTPDGYPEGTSDAECYNNDTSSPTPSPTDGTSSKILKGWWCVDSTHMYRQYSDGSREPDCTCGDNEGDCGGGTDATVCRNKDYSEVPAGYDVDAECIVPAVSSGSCYLGGDTDNNCVYSDSGQCYIGYTSDTENCNLTEDGVCFNPEAGCRYSCGPVACP